MTYKNKLILLSGSIAVLLIVNILTFVFDPQRRGNRQDMYAWIESDQLPFINRISISGTNEEQDIVLARNRDTWFVLRNEQYYPARQTRVEDFLAILSRRSPYPVRSTNTSYHEQFMLTEDQSSARIMITDSAGMPLLDLLLGQTDLSGQNIYMRKQGENEVRSGEDNFSTYIKSWLTSWFNLRVFPETEDGSLNAAHVQRFTVYPPADEETLPEPREFTREGRGWTFSFDLVDPDMTRVDTYLRDILNMSGDNFLDDIHPSDPMFNDSRIVLEFGDSSTRTIRFGPPESEQERRRAATVSGSDLVYTIAPWTISRIFLDEVMFERVQ